MSEERIILVDKPVGWTSNDVVRFLKGKLQPCKVGHAGTLDPFATGLLLVLVGSATKKFSELLNLKKEYEMEVCFGEERDTDDITGEVVSQYRGEVLLGRDIIEKVLSEHFLGKIIQTPPKYSAIKIGGKRAYDLSRKKKSFIVPRREVEIYESDVLEVKKNILKVRLIVSSGTYLRSVARDLGKILGFGAYAKSLRRTKVGGYKVEDAERLEQLSEKHKT